jgi:hypothetical protein
VKRKQIWVQRSETRYRVLGVVRDSAFRLTCPHDAKFYLFNLIIFIKKRINKIWVKEIYPQYYYFTEAIAEEKI